MLRYSANLTFLFTEAPFLERFGRAAAAGVRGYLPDPRRRDIFFKTLEDAMLTARRLGVRRLNVLAGNRVEGTSAAEHRRAVVESLRTAAPLAQSAGITLLIEALNTFEHPRYYLDR